MNHLLPRFIGLSILGSILLPGRFDLAAQGTAPTITVDIRNVLGKVNPLVFGNNVIAYQKGMWKHASPEYWDRGAGIWDPESARSVPEMSALAKLAGITALRFPGAQHYFDWKRTIGPVWKRPDQKFGLPEFLRFCSEVGAIPLITIPDFFGTAQDAADLVEYLNSPADGSHPWARQRTDDGFRKPWNVVWFEYGNETYLGSGAGTRMDANEYAKNYRQYRRAMKSVDKRIKLGIVSTNDYSGRDGWTRPILERLKTEVDFVIRHTYLPVYSRNDGIPEPEKLFAIATACDAQIQDSYERMNNDLRNILGRRIPVVVSEYNGHFTQDKPTPYRFTLGNALVNAVMLKVFLNPKNNVVMANSWQFSNEYWGAVKGYAYKGEPVHRRPLFYALQLYREHFGNELLSANVVCDTYDMDGGYGVLPAKGLQKRPERTVGTVALPSRWDLSFGLKFSQRMQAETLVVEFNGNDVNYFHARKSFVATPNATYHASGWIKTEGMDSSNGVRLELIDARGWDRTKSSSSSIDVRSPGAWRRVEFDYTPLPDVENIEIRARRTSGAGPIVGRAYFRDVEIRKADLSTFTATPYLSVNASRRILSGTGGKSRRTKVYLMVVNRHMTSPLDTDIRLVGMTPRSAQAWILTGPSVASTNEIDPNNVTVRMHDHGKVGNGFTVTFPPHSLTALEIE